MSNKPKRKTLNGTGKKSVSGMSRRTGSSGKRRKNVR